MTSGRPTTKAARTWAWPWSGSWETGEDLGGRISPSEPQGFALVGGLGRGESALFPTDSAEDYGLRVSGQGGRVDWVVDVCDMEEE